MEQQEILKQKETVQELCVNPLPSRTWNRLRMNDARIADVPVPKQGSFAEELPEGIRADWMTAADWQADAEFAAAAGGMGSDMDRLAAAAGVPARIYEIPDGAKVTEPLRLTFSYQPEQPELDIFGLRAGAGSEVTVLLDYRTADPEKPAEPIVGTRAAQAETSAAAMAADTEPGTADPEAGAKMAADDGFAAFQLKILAGPGARVRIVQVQELARRYRFLNDLGSVCGDDADLRVLRLVLDGDQTWMGCQAQLLGKNSVLTARTGYRVRGRERLDMNDVAIHRGRNTRCDLSTAGVLREQGFKLYRGTIDFKRGSAGAEGNEQEDVLLMDDTVVNQTIPLILCAEEDVEGNHGATIGRLDEELLFYLQSRGISREAGYEMMADARLLAVAAKIPDERLRGRVQETLQRR